MLSLISVSPIYVFMATSAERECTSGGNSSSSSPTFRARPSNYWRISQTLNFTEFEWVWISVNAIILNKNGQHTFPCVINDLLVTIRWKEWARNCRAKSRIWSTLSLLAHERIHNEDTFVSYLLKQCRKNEAISSVWPTRVLWEMHVFSLGIKLLQDYEPHWRRWRQWWMHRISLLADTFVVVRNWGLCRWEFHHPAIGLRILPQYNPSLHCFWPNLFSQSIPSVPIP